MNIYLIEVPTCLNVMLEAGSLQGIEAACEDLVLFGSA